MKDKRKGIRVGRGSLQTHVGLTPVLERKLVGGVGRRSLTLQSNSEKVSGRPMGSPQAGVAC